jgi:hypothetical protein
MVRGREEGRVNVSCVRLSVSCSTVTMQAQGGSPGWMLRYTLCLLLCFVTLVVAQDCSASNPCATGCCSRYVVKLGGFLGCMLTPRASLKAWILWGWRRFLRKFPIRPSTPLVREVNTNTSPQGADCVANCDYQEITECSESKHCPLGCCSKFGICGFGPDCELPCESFHEGISIYSRLIMIRLQRRELRFHLWAKVRVRPWWLGHGACKPGNLPPERLLQPVRVLRHDRGILR